MAKKATYKLFNGNSFDEIHFKTSIEQVEGLQDALSNVVTTPTWDQVTNKPTWIGSSKPTYSAADVEARPDDWTPTWAQVSDKPFTMTGSTVVQASPENAGDNIRFINPWELKQGIINVAESEGYKKSVSYNDITGSKPPINATTNTGTVTNVSAGTQVSGLSLSVATGTTTPKITTTIANAEHFRAAIGAAANDDAVKVSGTQNISGLKTFNQTLKLYSSPNNQDVTALRIGDRDNGYGFDIKYLGTGTGNNNLLELWADNAVGTPLKSISVDQTGLIAFSKTPTVNGINVSLASHAHTWAQVTGKPTFATVATSGSYANLSNTPGVLSIADGSTGSGTGARFVSGANLKEIIDTVIGNYNPENTNNKQTSVRSTGATDTAYVSELGVKTYVDNTKSSLTTLINQGDSALAASKQDNLGYTPENVSNKVTSIRSLGATNTAYVTELGVKSYVDSMIGSVYRPAGDWNASTNAPELSASMPANLGKVYRVSVEGTRFGYDWSVGDKLTFIEGGAVTKWDNVDDVTTVAGRKGNVVLTKSDVGLGSVNNYGIASQSAAQTGSVNNVYMTPLRTKQAITKNILDLGNVTESDIGIGTESTPRLISAYDLNRGINNAVSTRVPTSRTVNGKALSSNVTLNAADVGAAPTSRTINGKALTSNITLNAADVGAGTGTVTHVSAGTQVNGLMLQVDTGNTTPIIKTSILNQAQFRTAIGAGTSSLTIGTTSSTAKAGNYHPTWAQVTSKPQHMTGSTIALAANDTAGNTERRITPWDLKQGIINVAEAQGYASTQYVDDAVANVDPSGTWKQIYSGPSGLLSNNNYTTLTLNESATYYNRPMMMEIKFGSNGATYTNQIVTFNVSNNTSTTGSKTFPRTVSITDFDGRYFKTIAVKVHVPATSSTSSLRVGPVKTLVADFTGSSGTLAWTTESSDSLSVYIGKIWVLE